MAVIMRVPVVWSGVTGLPGVSVFHGVGTSTAVVTDLLSFFDAIKAFIPSGTQIQVPSSGDSIEDATGALAGSWSLGGGGTVSGTGSGAWAAGVGVAVTWRTGGIRNGRRVRGRTFLAPLISSSFDTSGTMDSTELNAIQAAADALVGGDELVVWSRPTTSGGSDGTSNLVTAATVPDRVTALRSRRY